MTDQEAEEILTDLHCMMQSVTNAKKIAKCLLGQVVTSLYIAVIVLSKKAAEIVIDQEEEAEIQIEAFKEIQAILTPQSL